MLSSLKRLDWPGVRKYWTDHSNIARALDYEADPDGLNVVCYAGAPLWLNQYHARTQTSVFQKLLRVVERPTPRGHALDVGCGAGRWSRLLRDHGFAVTGVDVQDVLLEANRVRFPDIEFIVSSIQEFDSETRFNLLSSVTVLQHLPFEEQEVAIRNLRRLANPGAHFIALENIRHQSAHMFTRSRRGWIDLFAKCGFEAMTSIAYDYSPAARVPLATAKALKRLWPGRRSGLDDRVPVPTKERWQRASRLKLAAMRLACGADGLIEPVLVKSSLPLPTVHAGFLFRAVS
jgi:SAM-dependent methyltransferase